MNSTHHQPDLQVPAKLRWPFGLMDDRRRGRDRVNHAIRQFAQQVGAPNRYKYRNEADRHNVQLIAAQRAAWAAVVAPGRPYCNPLDVAHDLAELAKSAPRDFPCRLDRLGLERLAVDFLHLAREREAMQ